MGTNIYSIIIGGIVILAIWGGIIYLLYLAVKTMRIYIKTHTVRMEKAATAKSMGEVLKQHRTDCKMTQEFVAESIFVSRQAVSKWESGASEPSTSNLVALAKLYGVTAEELLKETLGQNEGASAKGGAQK